MESDLDMEDVDLAHESTPPTEETLSEQLDPMVRLKSIFELDQQITQILSRAEAVVKAIANGKQKHDPTKDKEEFSQAVNEYNKLVEEVNHKMRMEHKYLREASKADLLPLRVPKKASSVGDTMKSNILDSIWALEYNNMDVTETNDETV
ncbi:hypothetical protein DASB73_019430 [Starmerella bacillaris]|uniref:Mediator of RNA polymerase II transcription subunit 11 n=1 Tax=Starmerella bacillaris TaxID=1247836 RepID=A0AAV5RHW4_STABA|nr:hypothetical protein DASB73_019430 [Starmerella bacillaris]